MELQRMYVANETRSGVPSSESHARKTVRTTIITARGAENKP